MPELKQLVILLENPPRRLVITPAHGHTEASWAHDREEILRFKEETLAVNGRFSEDDFITHHRYEWNIRPPETFSMKGAEQLATAIANGD